MGCNVHSLKKHLHVIHVKDKFSTIFLEIKIFKIWKKILQRFKIKCHFTEKYFSRVFPEIEFFKNLQKFLLRV